MNGMLCLKYIKNPKRIAKKTKEKKKVWVGKAYATIRFPSTLLLDDICTLTSYILWKYTYNTMYDTVERKKEAKKVLLVCFCSALFYFCLMGPLQRWCHASWALSEEFSCPLVHQYFSSAVTKVCQYCSSTVAVVAALEALGCWLPGSEFSGQHYPELAASLPGSPRQAELSH
jgi:hypothetical protein